MDETKRGWINEKYVAACLGKESGEIKKYSITNAVGKGDNYASTLLRITVQLENNKVNENEKSLNKNVLRKFVIKCLPEGLMGKLVQDSGIWDKEVFMYRNVLPVIEGYVKCKIGPKCLNNYSKGGVHKEIVLEDLSYNYKMADRREQLDYKHCVVVMKKLAKFHAGSVAARNTHKEYVDAVGDELCFRESRKETNELYFRQPFKNLAEHIKDDVELKRYGKCLKNFGEKFWDLALYAAKPKSFNVLNHGDLWTNNILFQYDDAGEPVDARLIDFQCCRYTTPAFDLQYFFMSSLKEEERELRLHDLVDIYRHQLNKELVKLGEPTLSKEDLYCDLLITDCYGLYASIFVLPTSIRDITTLDENDDILDTEMNNMYSKCIQSKKYQSMLPKILAFYHDKGLFKENYSNKISKKYCNIIKDQNEESTISL